jgi:hypothetical protein
LEALVEGGAFQSHRFADVATPFGTFHMAAAYRASSDFEVGGAGVG